MSVKQAKVLFLEDQSFPGMQSLDMAQVKSVTLSDETIDGSHSSYSLDGSHSSYSKNPLPVNISPRNLAHMKGRWLPRWVHHIQIILPWYNFPLIQDCDYCLVLHPACSSFVLCVTRYLLEKGGLLCIPALFIGNLKELQQGHLYPEAIFKKVSGFTSFIFPPSSTLNARPKFPV